MYSYSFMPGIHSRVERESWIADNKKQYDLGLFLVSQTLMIFGQHHPARLNCSLHSYWWSQVAIHTQKYIYTQYQKYIMLCDVVGQPLCTCMWISLQRSWPPQRVVTQAHSEVSEVGYSPSLSIIIIYILLPVLGYMDNCLEIAIYNVM